MVDSPDGSWLRFEGETVAVEQGQPAAARYTIALDDRWRTRSVRVVSLSPRGRRTVALEGDGAGSWLVDGRGSERLEGCLDVDLEFSVVTNAFPVHRLDVAVGETAAAPAVYVRAVSLDVDRLDQRYVRLDDSSRGQRYDYTAPAFQFNCVLRYDEAGLIWHYPGLARRLAERSGAL